MKNIYFCHDHQRSELSSNCFYAEIKNLSFLDGSWRSECNGDIKLKFFSHQHGVVNIVAIGT